jgi:RTX calcium-binding nonapeptide repeat (4 copies)
MAVRYQDRGTARRSTALAMGVMATFAVIAVLLAPGASAATIDWDGDWLVYEAEPGEDNELYVQPPPGDCVLGSDPCVLFSDRVAIVEIPIDCDWVYSNDDRFVDCPEPAGVVAALGDGNDSFDLWEGDSEVDGGPGADDISGYGGDDVIDGGEGNDQLSGWTGDDTISGGPGNDSFEVDATAEGDPPASAGRDLLSGGPGWERISYELVGEPVSLTLDGVANDGPSGEGDNIASDIEELEGGTADDTLIGDDGPNRLSGSLGNDRLEGRGGNDFLDGSVGADLLLGEAGDDELRGDGGDDTIDGGAGADQFFGDRTCTVFSCRLGDDEIQARDGTRDSIACGGGADHATVDREDVLASDPWEACERVDLPPCTGATCACTGTTCPCTPGTCPCTGATCPPPCKNPSDCPRPRTSIPAKLSLKRALNAGIPIGLTCSGRCQARAEARIGSRAARRLGLPRGATKVASGSKALEAAGSGTLVLKLTAKAKRRLKHARRVKLALAVTVTDGSGEPTRAGSSLTLVKRSR